MLETNVLKDLIFYRNFRYSPEKVPEELMKIVLPSSAVTDRLDPVSVNVPSSVGPSEPMKEILPSSGEVTSSEPVNGLDEKEKKPRTPRKKPKTNRRDRQAEE